jgi:hypothetical protein
MQLRQSIIVQEGVQQGADGFATMCVTECSVDDCSVW